MKNIPSKFLKLMIKLHIKLSASTTDAIVNRVIAKELSLDILELMIKEHYAISNEAINMISNAVSQNNLKPKILFEMFEQGYNVSKTQISSMVQSYVRQINRMANNGYFPESVFEPLFGNANLISYAADKLIVEQIAEQVPSGIWKDMVIEKKAFADYTKQQIIKMVVSKNISMSILFLMLEQGYIFSKEDWDLLSGSSVECIIVSYATKINKQPLL